MKRKEAAEDDGSVASSKTFDVVNNYATQFKTGIRLEVPEAFRIYLTSDVISQRHGIARLCLRKRRRGQMSAPGSDRAEMAKGKRL
jgi:hypothetical protein